jgi:hypothetical protein
MPEAEERESGSGALYVYGVTRASSVADSIPGAGVDLQTVAYRDLAAIASPIADGTVKARREDLIRHADVLQRVMGFGTVLPLRFGTVFADRQSAIDDLLTARYDELADLLRSLDGYVELTVRAFYRDDAILAEIVRDNPRIANLRDASRAAPQFEALQAQLGEAVAKSLAAKRSADADELVASLVTGAHDVLVEEPRAEYEVLRGAFLVRQDNVEEFDARMDRLSRAHEGRILFKYTGPLPPHSFVTSLASRMSG